MYSEMELNLASFGSFVMFLFIQGFEAVAFFNQEPISPQNVTEGQNVSLSWSYNIAGTFQQAQLRRIYADGSSKVIIQKFPNMNPTIARAVRDRFHVQIISNTQTTLTITGIPRSDSGMYRYEISNDNLDSDQSDVEILVWHKSNITTFFAGNQTLNESVSLNLTCAADGNPKPSITWTRLSDSSTINSTLKITGKDVEGEYRCTASNGVGNPDSRTVYIIVENYRPIDTIVTTNLIDNTVVMNTTFNVTCSATARPSAKYRFFKGIEFVNDTDSDGVITTFINERVKKVDYSCVPYNFYGNGSIKVVAVTVHFAPTVTNLTISSFPRYTTVLANSTVTIHCAANANPPALYHLYSIESYFGSSNSGEFNITVESDEVYTCVPINTVGQGSNATLSFTVVEPSEIIKMSQDFCVGSEGALNCTATGKPPPKITWTRVWKNGTDSKELSADWNYVVPNVSRTSNGSYRCTAFNGVGNPVNQTVEAILAYPASVIRVVNSSNTVIEGDNFSLSCQESGHPPPTVAWIKVGIGLRSHEKVLNFTTISRHDNGDYRCEASNKCGKKSMTTTVDVYYKPVEDGSTKFVVVENKEVYLHCPITGNPTPEYNWFKNNQREKTKRGRTWVFQGVESSDSGSYTCSAKNYLGKENVTVSLEVVSVTALKTVDLKLVIKEEANNATERNRTCKTTSNNACRVSTNCVDNKVLDCRNGSIVVEFQLKFSRNVTVSEVISDLKEAVTQGEFGSLEVVASSIKQIYPLSTTTEPTTKVVPSTKVPECPESFVKNESCELKYLNISVVIILVVGVIVMVIVITYCVHKKRKCRKNTRVKNSDGLPLNHSTLSDSNLYANDNGGYHKSGPQPTVEIAREQSLEAAGGEQIPTYAKVDKSKKKDQKKNNEAAEQKLTEDQYAVVDKSKKKKKKKNEQDNTYAEADMSKKSKKKQKQGEVLYADLDQFHQMQKMPEVSTSPKLLPPIKMPETYGETQYADITQFLRGNPEDAGAELLKDSSTPAVSNTAIGSKAKSSAGKTGDGLEGTNETGF